ncbi:MAG: nitrogen fixation negative regulator NifL [Gammaproteobacteria bacterium]|nr:nitrogen fixation negative regulator NifL [Gammaproteobacteria bacterium]
MAQLPPSTVSERIEPLPSDVIMAFLAAPPEGTPAEVLAAFVATEGGRFLPPRLFVETVEQAPVAISITDPSAKILYVNQSFEKLTGFDRLDVIGRKESILSSDSTPVEVYRQLWETIREGKVWSGRLVNLRQDKSEYLAELTISPVYSAREEIAYYLGMHRDITPLHQLEQRLTFQRGLTEAALNAVPMLVAVINSERKVLLHNHAYTTLQEDLAGAEPGSLLLDALFQQSDYDFKSACHAGQSFSNLDVRLDIASAQSPRWFSCSGVRVRELDDAAGDYFHPAPKQRCCLLLTANEVTESRNRIQEARLNMIRSRMDELRRIQTMRETLSAAIFKLQAPMNVIRAALAMETPRDPESLRTVLEQVLENGDDALATIESALPVTVTEQRSDLSINALLQEVLKLSTEKLLAAGVVVDWRPDPLLPLVKGQENGLRGLFLALIDNAITALAESGKSQREIRIQNRVAGEAVLVEVMDNGTGIEEEIRFKVFEPFFCGWRRAGKHAGVGLSIAQEVMVNHGGSIEVDPNFQGGCRLFVRIPVNGEEGSRDHG